jgi:small subunit ribosomal protein S7
LAEDEKKDEQANDDIKDTKLKVGVSEEVVKSMETPEVPKEKKEPLPPPPPPPPVEPATVPTDKKVEEKPKDEAKDKEEPKKVEKEERPKKVEEKEEKKTEDDEEKKIIKKPKKEEKKKEKPEELVPGLSSKIFGKYDLNEVEIEDPGLRRYINLKPIGIPHSGAKHANKSFGKTKVNIVERLINNMMRTEHTTGKKSRTFRTVSDAFDIIAKRTKQNPVQVLINALQNTSPKEEITRLRFGGISVPKAVDTSSSHRLDVALRNICKGAVNSSHKNKKRMEVCLAEEIILASKADMNSFAISKKEEMERIAASAR